MPTVVIAPDSFKGSLGAREVARALADGWRSVRPDDRIELRPQADGGEGTLDALEASVPGARRRQAGTVTGPDGRPTPGEWLELPDAIAVVELAQCSGLPLMARLDPGGATTFGLGEVIAHALDAGAEELVIALGGSASTDGGAGALQALGMTALDGGSRPLAHGGAALLDLAAVDLTGLRPPPAVGVTLLSDVTNPLLGPTGAAAIFGPQKGADAEQVRMLDAALVRWASVLGGDPGIPGSGAAGGTAFGFATAWGATIASGADHIAERSGLPEAIGRADVVLTGEGRFDEQSRGGKVVGRILDRAREHGTPVAVVAGQMAADAGTWSTSLTGIAGSLAAALEDPERWLRDAGARAARDLG